jgi:hypothetical protein
VTSVGEAANGLNIRGGTTDQNLILLDDTPIFNPTHMFGLFSVFPPDAVSGLDLYKGNVPARYGGRAASVLDISLTNPDLGQFRLTGGVSLVANRLTVETPIVKGKLALLVSGRGAFNDFLLRACFAPIRQYPGQIRRRHRQAFLACGRAQYRHGDGLLQRRSVPDQPAGQSG